MSLFWQSRSSLFWVLLTVILLSLAFWFLTQSSTKDRKTSFIPADALSKIEEEKAKARKGYEDFIKTPAGKIWEKHPYWDRETCEKIAEGQVFPGMSKEQVKEAIGLPKKVKTANQGGKHEEEWLTDGSPGMVLRFEGHVLKSVERK